ncbi:LPXTG cell wall anchor domain-containing protein [Halalkalibacter kiskunsagensis]|uniref:LPXTG cell wall anchor domain-containing protein n=1 Tax=Halalkalibacter kiskunsagensis TaxID=1548599 RepID=A0ABV6K6P8_9BACI
MWGFIIWGETLTIASLLGGLLIIAGSIALSRRKKEIISVKEDITIKKGIT